MASILTHGSAGTGRMTPRSARSDYGAGPRTPTGLGLAGQRAVTPKMSSLTPVVNGVRPKIHEMEMMIEYQLNLTKTKTAALVKEDKQADNSQHLLDEMKAACAEHLAQRQEELKRFFQQQKAESYRMQKQIGRIKDEHCSHRQQLLGLQRRIADLEDEIGT